MDALAAPGDGWRLEGAGARRAAHGRPAEAWVYASRLTYEWQADPRLRAGGFLDERAEPIELWRRARGASQPEGRT